MNESKRSLSSGAAIAVGTLVVNLPVFGLLLGPAFAAASVGRDDLLTFVLPLSFVAAWGWWSFSVPRWRLWAYERVESTSEVDQKALTAGLVWPRGSFLERTEIKSPAQRQRQEQLERNFP